MVPLMTDTDGSGATSPATVIHAYLVISGLFTLSASVIWGVNTLFLLDAGLDIFQVFLANAAFTVGTLLFEIPTGVVADTTGRRRSFLLSTLTLMVGTVGYVSISLVGGGLALFALASIVLGIGFCFYSGAVEAWLVDALRASGYEGGLDPVFARGSMVSGAAMLIGSVGGGLLGTVDLAWPYVVRAALLGAAFVVGLRLMHDIGFEPRARTSASTVDELRDVLHRGIAFGWNKPAVRLLMFVSVFQSAFMMWGFYAWQPYFLELLGRDAVWVTGVVSALIALATIAGNGVVELLRALLPSPHHVALWRIGGARARWRRCGAGRRLLALRRLVAARHRRDGCGDTGAAGVRARSRSLDRTSHRHLVRLDGR